MTVHSQSHHGNGTGNIPRNQRCQQGNRVLKSQRHFVFSFVNAITDLAGQDGCKTLIAADQRRQNTRKQHPSSKADPYRWHC